MNGTLLLRIAVAIILLTHSVFGMFNNGINDFGNLYLNQIGFAPFGVLIAWSVKLSHIVAAILFILNKYIKPAGFVTIFVLIMGIVLVHFQEGWFVVGGGRNGVEYNFLLICVLLAIMYPNGFKSVKTKD
ncbi:DoxX family membrane protein [Flavobacterium sp. GA093]|uniref:DoxX family membrane protein n=1 Tax=Flavobacterium hydrocarbonoxydans TaxID=2683249 RepID=A0A6I4NZ47_9FLAO|nr:DoxX family membrane protein [Flavobacterium hydrocarbonoxydans]MWB96327.1 DoxX family membrane protein [Flavobacterium hydrocarbonoxydans]